MVFFDMTIEYYTAGGTMTRRNWILPALVLSACASAKPAPPPPAPAARSLTYAATTPTASYSFADSTALKVQGGPIGEINVNINASGSADEAFAAKANATEATIRITKLNGSMTNSAMGGGPTATEADMTGPIVASVSPSGRVTITSLPKLSPTIQRVGISEAFFHRFFVHLPPQPVGVGASWSDTVALSDSAANVFFAGRDVVTSTLQGDTVVNGRTLTHITATFTRVVTISGASEGVQIVEKLSGNGTGDVLWDAERHLLVSRFERAQLTGTFDLPAMGLSGLPVTAQSTSRVVLH
jgi:hypothetical protein